jgi:hypothetical protein
MGTNAPQVQILSRAPVFARREARAEAGWSDKPTGGLRLGMPVYEVFPFHFIHAFVTNLALISSRQDSKVEQD